MLLFKRYINMMLWVAALSLNTCYAHYTPFGVFCNSFNVAF